MSREPPHKKQRVCYDEQHGFECKDCNKKFAWSDLERCRRCSRRMCFDCNKKIECKDCRETWKCSNCSKFDEGATMCHECYKVYCSECGNGGDECSKCYAENHSICSECKREELKDKTKRVKNRNRPHRPVRVCKACFSRHYKEKDLLDYETDEEDDLDVCHCCDELIPPYVVPKLCDCCSSPICDNCEGHRDGCAAICGECHANCSLQEDDVSS